MVGDQRARTSGSRACGDLTGADGEHAERTDCMQRCVEVRRAKDVSARTCSAYAGDKVLQVLQNEGKHCSSPDDAPELGPF